MYQSPIDVMIQDLRMQQEDEIFRAVQNVGVVVDKDELIMALAYDRGQYQKGYTDGLNNAVRHGQWVTDDFGHTHCSRCGERLPFMHCYSDEPCSDYDEEWDEEIPETRYCPNCGAKMDGGTSDG